MPMARLKPGSFVWNDRGNVAQPSALLFGVFVDSAPPPCGICWSCPMWPDDILDISWKIATQKASSTMDVAK